MRVTDQMMLDQSLLQIQRAQERQQKTQGLAASGQQVSVPSDDPLAWNQISGGEAQLTRLAGYGSNITRVRSQLSATEASLQSMQGDLSRLREVTLVALNASGDTTSAITEAQQIYTSLLSQANQSFDGQFLYSGYSGSAPFSGATFVGDNSKRAVEVSPLGATQFGISAKEAFGVDPGQDIFTGIANTIAAMKAGDHTKVAAGLDAIDGYLQGVAHALVSVGVQQNTLSVAEQSNQAYQQALNTSIGQQRDIDPAKVYSQLSADQYAVQATFAVIGSASKLSLINYL